MPGPGSDAPTTRDAVPARLTGAAAIKLHLTLAAGLAVCIVAFAVEVVRATGGNTLSWAYVFEWPVLAGFGLYMWWSLLNGRDRRQRGAAGGDDPDMADAAALGGEPDERLEAWRRYLAALEASDAERLDTAP
ncbi:MAG TPA: hypothetical protein VEI83_09120 [Acidimicrobiales bacterium]|nr:hypothetical protein [Acidimicrobiales bacterium]